MTFRAPLSVIHLLVLAMTGLGAAGARAAANEPGSLWATNGFRGIGCSTFAIPDLPSVYYGIDLVPTKRVPGTGQAKGWGKVSFGGSPFGVSVSPDGHYVYDIDIEIEKMKSPKQGVLTAWVATSELDQIRKLGPLAKNDGDGEGSPFRVRGRVEWNKFLLVVTLEPSGEASGGSGRWQGPVVLRGMSRSGMMHTLAGHGPYESEPCAKYGFR